MDTHLTAFGYVVAGYQLFISGGYCQDRKLNSIIFYDFIVKKMNLSPITLPCMELNGTV